MGVDTLFGTIVNFASIILGSILGLILKEAIPSRIKDTVMKSLALCVLLLGIIGVTGKSANLSSENILLIIGSMVIGAIIGELIDIDKRLKNFGDLIEKKLNGRGGKISEGFVTSSILYCTGAMAIVGSLESGLLGQHNTLFAKSMLDGVSSVFFASTLGIGVAISAISVLLYQGAITLLASSLKVVLIPVVIDLITVIGNLLIIGIALNMLEVTKIKVANILPGIMIPIIYYIFI